MPRLFINQLAHPLFYTTTTTPTPQPSANISITKFDKWTGYNFTYQKPPTNFSVTLQKPGKPKWGKEDGVFVKTEETKGVTINGTLEPPIVSF